MYTPEFDLSSEHKRQAEAAYFLFWREQQIYTLEFDRSSEPKRQAGAAYFSICITTSADGAIYATCSNYTHKSFAW